MEYTYFIFITKENIFTFENKKDSLLQRKFNGIDHLPFSEVGDLDKYCSSLLDFFGVQDFSSLKANIIIVDADAKTECRCKLVSRLQDCKFFSCINIFSILPLVAEQKGILEKSEKLTVKFIDDFYEIISDDNFSSKVSKTEKSKDAIEITFEDFKIINTFSGKLKEQFGIFNKKIEQSENDRKKYEQEIENLKKELKKQQDDAFSKSEPVRTIVKAPCSGMLEFGKNEILKSESGTYSEQWNSKKKTENIFYVKDEEMGRIRDQGETTSNNKTTSAIKNASLFFGNPVVGSIMGGISAFVSSLKYESVKSPAFGFVFTKKNSCKVEKGEIVAVISSDCNDTNEKIEQWLEKNPNAKFDEE